jgi:hypothetical protein
MTIRPRRRSEDRPDPDRLAARSEQFKRAAQTCIVPAGRFRFEFNRLGLDRHQGLEQPVVDRQRNDRPPA